jgi:two-component system, NtrC family, sensor kinase
VKRQKPRRLGILVVDDEVEVGHSVRRILGRDHRVDVVSSSLDALEMLAASSYDLILCDLLMPDVTGMDLHARVTEVWPEAARRMVFMTGGAFGPLASDFLLRVPNASFEKPFDAKALRAVVAAARKRS